MKTVMFRVEGMHCKSCEMLIKDALENLGVKKTEADKNNGTVKVHFAEEKLELQQIRKIIENEGYKIFGQKILS